MDKKKLHLLAWALNEAKHAEQAAKRVRVSLEEDIASHVQTDDSGQKTITLEDGSKITVKRGLIYKADVQDVREVFSSKTGEFLAPITVKVEEKLDIKGYEWYRENHPEIFNEFTEFVTVTQKKVAVTLKMKE